MRRAISIMKWTREKVAALKTEELPKLRVNAEKANVNDVIAWCDEELSLRNVKAARLGRTARPDDERNAESEAAALLRTFASGLLAKYDLSAETAKRLSKGIKGFRAVELLGKTGSAKLGGLQRNGSVSLESYISYRLRDDRVFLAYLLLKDRPISEARWVTFGPRRLLPDAQLVAEQMEGLGNIYAGEVGLVTESFAAASDLFAQLIREFAPERSPSQPS